MLIARLDTVRSSVGADDNASGIAAVLEVARQLRGREHRVVIAIVDLEKLWHLGARELARTLPRPGLVVCLDAVGYFDDRPLSQRLPAGLGFLFPRLARQLRANERRGSFLLAVHRRSSSAFATSWEQAAAAAGLPAALLCDPRWNGRGQRATHWVNPLLMDLDRSDHEPFWRAHSGGAAHRERHAAQPHYHRSTDTPETLDYARLAQVADSLSTSLAGAAALGANRSYRPIGPNCRRGPVRVDWHRDQLLDAQPVHLDHGLEGRVVVPDHQGIPVPALALPVEDQPAGGLESASVADRRNARRRRVATRRSSAGSRTPRQLTRW